MKTALGYALMAVVAIAAATFVAGNIGAAINAPLAKVAKALEGK